MSCCNIYNHSFVKDIRNLEWIKSDPSVFPKINSLISLFKPFDSKMSGIWQPAVILPEQSSINYVDMFTRAQPLDTILDPCNCSDINEIDTPFEEQNLDCEYCNKTDPINNVVSWSITDETTGKSVGPIQSTYCEGANDVRMYPDDYLTKLPVLNNTYLSGLYDFKYLNQFPAASNHNLGWEQFVSVTINSIFFKSLSSEDAKLVIDWNICEKIGEIPPNDVDSYHNTIDDHEKSYNRYLNTGKTCGNFILLKPHDAYENTNFYPRYPQLDNAIGKINNQNLTPNQLPKPEAFTIPYGFKNQDFYNIFSSGDTKLGSHWKWNYTSGIICWYRYSDIDIPANLDDRIVPGIDIYIPEGDVFFAKNQGPENATQGSSNTKSCPSGIKLISSDKTVTGVIPGDSEFVYISQNIYDKAYSIFYKLDSIETKFDLPSNTRKTPRQKLELACIIATSPNYDEITVDLLEQNFASVQYIRNNYQQIDIFNTHMLKKPIDRSANTLNIVKNYQDLFNTLANKYGSYIWIPEQSTNSITLQNLQPANLAINLDFQPVVNKNSLVANVNASGQKDCNQTTTNKEYYYDQTLGIGPNQLYTQKNTTLANKSCFNGQLETIGSVNTASVYHVNSLVKTQIYSSGSINFNNTYLRPVSYDLALDIVGEINLCSVGYLCNKTLAVKYNNENNTLGSALEYTEGVFRDDSVKLNRGYSASFFNPNINLCGFHKDGGVYFDSNSFGNDNLCFNKSLENNSTRPSPPTIAFSTRDVGIKIYSIQITKLRDRQNPECKTFPLDQACKCFSLKQITDDYKYNCDNTLVYSNVNKILYTPNISTHNSPDIKSYGDFSKPEIVERFGKDIIIPNHIDHGYPIPVVTKKIDPLNPYDCSKNITINLPNYTKTTWNLSLNKYVTDDNHSDIWATVSETVDLFRSTIFTDPEDIIYDHVTSAVGTSRTPTGFGLGTLFGFSYDPFSEQEREQDAITEEEQIEIYEPITNPFYRRYTNEIKINNKSWYNRQTKILSDSNNLSIEIKNPFLLALMKQVGAEEEILYTPTQCSMDGTPYSQIISSHNPWLTNVNITFHQQPRKQLLMYQIHPLKSMGVLHPGFFHPNFGLEDIGNGTTSLVFDRNKCYYDFDYERNLFNQNKKYSTSGSMYYAKLTKKDQSVLDIVSSLSCHKKLRLYLKSNNIWYEYLNPHIFGFYNKYDNNLYPGAAAFFEYTNYDKPKSLTDHKILDTNSNILITKPSPLIPASAKINIPFNYIVPSTVLSSKLEEYFYPDVPIAFQRGFDNPNSILIDSIRPYFFFKEESDYLDIMVSIEQLVPNDNRIGFGTVILDNQKKYWKYNKGPKNSEYSYELLSERSYYDNNFSSLHFVFDESTIASNGIVNNSYAKIQPQTVELIDSNDPTFNTIKPYTIIAKYLIAQIVDEKGNKIEENNPIAPTVFGKKFVKIYTVLVTSLCEECSIEYANGYILFSKNALTIYQKLTPGSLYNEYNQLLVNRKANYITKWGDLINYDFNSNPDLNDSIYIHSYIDQHYPFKKHTDQYNNLADNFVLNNLSTGINTIYLSYNQFTSSGKPDRIRHQLINYKGTTHYIQHQKYHSDPTQIYELYTDQYNNFIPLFDIIFLDDTTETLDFYANTLINSINNISSTGTVFISGLRQFTTTGLLSYQDPPGVENVLDNSVLKPFILSLKPDQDSYMILSLDNEVALRPILFDKQFYYPTPRIDETYFPFLRNSFYSNQDGSNCVSFTTPNISYTIDPGREYFSYDGFDKISNNIKRPYFIFPIYCDNDAAPECGTNLGCKYQTAGGVVLESEYQHLEYLPKKFKDIAGGPYEYVLSTDEGLYNILHGDATEFPYIQRFEIPPSDEIFNQLASDYNTLDQYFQWTNYSVENRKIAPKYSYLDSEFQNKLSLYKNTFHTSLVINTDILANEMLFRLIYGSKQSINIETIKKKTIEDTIAVDLSKNPWSYLLQYKDIQTKPEKIYELIPYDYSRLSDQSRRKINGNISIDGVPDIGIGFSVDINNKLISFNIENIDGTIYLVAQQGSLEAKVVLGYLYQTSETLLAVEVDEQGQAAPPAPPDANTSIEKLSDCNGGIPSKSWSAGQYFSEMRYTSVDQNGAPKEVDMVAEYKKCVAMMVDPYGCIVVPNGEEAPDPSVVRTITTFPGAICSFTCSSCDSRGYAENVTPPDGCSLIQKTKKSIKLGGIGRGTFGIDDELLVGCSPRYSSISLTPGLSRGDFDAFAGGIPVLSMSASLNCNRKSEPCSTYCHPIGGTDKFGDIFTPFRIGAFGNTAGLPCECRIPTYGYCSAARNSCDPCLPYDTINFTYSFENLYGQFSSNGHVIKINKSDPIVHDGNTSPTSVCGKPVGLTPEPNNKNANGSEVCFWNECTGPKPPSYSIYKSTTKIPTEYNPLCPQKLVTIEYDNNTTKVSLIGLTSDVLCFENIIRKDCPEITITLPNDKFSFNDSINSECSTCDVEPNKIDMNEQSPPWEIIIEDRVSIVGTLAIEGDLNEDVVLGGGQTSAPIEICGGSAKDCCYDGCYKTEGAGVYQCGKDAPDSWVWNYVLDCELNGSPSPSFAPCIAEFETGQGTLFSNLVNGKSRIGFATGSDNKAVKYRHKEYWKKLMVESYKDLHICQNNANIPIADIIEGLVPGSCGELTFSSISFPATAYRQTLSGGESASISYTVDIAYYTYKYKRPKTIEDILIGKNNASNCKTKLHISGPGQYSPFSTHNITEKYAVKSEDCQTTPVCYDKVVDRCDPNNFCCQVNKPSLS